MFLAFRSEHVIFSMQGHIPQMTDIIQIRNTLSLLSGPSPTGVLRELHQHDQRQWIFVDAARSFFMDTTTGYYR